MSQQSADAWAEVAACAAGDRIACLFCLLTKEQAAALGARLLALASGDPLVDWRRVALDLEAVTDAMENAWTGDAFSMNDERIQAKE